MHVPLLGLVVLAEILLVLLGGLALLWLQNRRLRSLTGRLQERMGEMVEDIRGYRARQAAAKEDSGGGSYVQKLEQQLKLTRQYHGEIADGHEIALDLDVESPLPRRVAALRYAMLVAERDALGEKTDEEPNWDKLQGRYQQLMAYYAAAEDDDDDDSPEAAGDLEGLREELAIYQKRVINLERFKALYFELESRWNACREEAQTHYDELSEMGAQLENSEGFEETLQNYHQSYQGIADLVEGDAETVIADSASARAAQKATGEIRHLRNVAADQHRIIYDLQQKLAEATSQEETSALVKTLQEELDKQLRYAQESDTCIQLLEDELASANREAEQAQTKLKQFRLVKAELKDMQAAKDEQEKLIISIKSENQRLKNSLRAMKKTPPQQTADPALKKKLSALQLEYAQLEEKYLDLKLQN